jgi:uncharacterized protein
MNDQDVVEHTRRWISSFVIGLGLCPFARQVFDAGGIRYAVSGAQDEIALLGDLTSALHFLHATPRAETETMLLIHPHVLGNFLEYNEFLGVVEQLLGDLRLRGIIQVASFHPEYRFAGTAIDAAENYTNRSPYPMLHLLREASVSQAADAGNDLLEIPRRNVATLRSLGLERILKQLDMLAGEQ